MLFGPDSGGPSLFAGIDKVVHVVLFALIAATTRWRFGASLVALAAVVAYAPVSELIQGGLLPQRSGDPYDVLADLVGAALGWLLATRLLSRR